MSVNKVILLGNLGSDPDMKQLPSGEPVTNISLATSRYWTDKNGERKENTEWHRVVFFNIGKYKLAENAAQYLRKGSKVYIEGRLQTRKWQDKDGKDQYTTEIVAEEMQMLDGKNAQQEPQQQQYAPAPQQQYAPPQQPMQPPPAQQYVQAPPMQPQYAPPAPQPQQGYAPPQQQYAPQPPQQQYTQQQYAQPAPQQARGNL